MYRRAGSKIFEFISHFTSHIGRLQAWNMKFFTVFSISLLFILGGATGLLQLDRWFSARHPLQASLSRPGVAEAAEISYGEPSNPVFNRTNNFSGEELLLLENLFAANGTSDGALHSVGAADIRRTPPSADSLSLGSPDFEKRLGELLVLHRLFRDSKNGILSPGNASLGDLFILNQLFR